MIKALKTVAIGLNLLILATFVYFYGVSQAQPKEVLPSPIDCAVAQAIYEQNQ